LNANLNAVYRNIRDLVERQCHTYRVKVDQQRITRLHYLNIPVFGELQGKVTHTVLRLLHYELKLSRRADFPTECTCKTLTTMGFPCGHTLQRRHAAGEPVLLTELHHHWLLEPQHPMMPVRHPQVPRKLIVLRRSHCRAPMPRSSPESEVALPSSHIGLAAEGEHSRAHSNSSPAQLVRPEPATDRCLPRPTTDMLLSTRRQTKGKGIPYVKISWKRCTNLFRACILL
jgi:hypothetical protein